MLDENRSDKNDITKENNSNVSINRRHFVKAIGATGAGAVASNLVNVTGATSSEIKKEDVPDTRTLKGSEKDKSIEEIKTDDEAKQVLSSLEQDNWYPQFKSGKYRSVGDRRYAVIPLQSDNAGVDDEACVLWLENNPTDENAPKVAGYRRIKSGDEYEYTTTRVSDGQPTHVTPNDIIRPPPGSCETCVQPKSTCDLVDQNWYCFVDTVGWAVSLPVFFAGCKTCLGTLGWVTWACAGCLGSLLRGTPANPPCQAGFYNNCEITGYYCVPDDYETQACR